LYAAKSCQPTQELIHVITSHSPSSAPTKQIHVFSRIGDDCGLSVEWLDIYDPKPGNCLSAVLSNVKCSQNYFPHATDGDHRCGCFRPNFDVNTCHFKKLSYGVRTYKISTILHPQSTIKSSSKFILRDDVHINLMRDGVNGLAMNPSVVWWDGKWSIAVRWSGFSDSHPEYEEWSDILWQTWTPEFASLETETILKHEFSGPFASEYGGLEDPRIFIWKDELWVVATYCRRVNKQKYGWTFDTKMAMLPLQRPSEVVKLAYGENEKNWLPFVVNDALYMIYRSGKSIEILSVSLDSIERIFAHPAALSDRFRGSSAPTNVHILNLGIDALLYVGHFSWRDGEKNCYAYQMVLLESIKPFQPLYKSSMFVIEPSSFQVQATMNDDWQNCDEWVYISSAFFRENRVFVGLGINDRKYVIVSYAWDIVQSLFNDFQDHL